MGLNNRIEAFARMVASAKDKRSYPYFKPISRSWGPEVEVDGRKLVMAGSNDYLGLAHDERVTEAAIEAVKRWGSGPGGSRFLSGNMSLHDELEERLADFVGKKKAVVHTTGFLTNLGALSLLIDPSDVILGDRENHASIFAGCRASRAKIIPFEHNDAQSAMERLENAKRKFPDSTFFLVFEGVYSMSGDICALDELVKIKEKHPDVVIYLDDAHGLGVMGPHGRGTAQHFNVLESMDYIMGTFSKALASIGGFIASDDVDALNYLKHQSMTLIFSAALPASNAATVLKCLDILEKEPERVQRLWDISKRVREGYENLDLIVGASRSPIVPIYIGPEEKAFEFAAALFEEGVFALPAIHPAVPRGHALIRTAFMSTHEDKHLEFVFDVLAKLSKKFGIRKQDLEEDSKLRHLISEQQQVRAQTA